MHKRLSRSLSNKSINPRKKFLGPWDEAVLEAQNQIDQIEQEAAQKIARLLESMRTFEALRNSDAVFPSETANKEIAA
jgi:hypothetical protein